MAIVFRVTSNVDGIDGHVIDYDVVPGQEITAPEAAAIAAAEAADAIWRIEQRIGNLGEIAGELARLANNVD